MFPEGETLRGKTPAHLQTETGGENPTRENPSLRNHSGGKTPRGKTQSCNIRNIFKHWHNSQIFSKDLNYGKQ
jgi:hypothetical protein